MISVFSFGGGVQSTAVAVLAARGELRVDAFVFANVGEDSENPATLRYISEIMRPYMQQHALTFVEVRKPNATLREVVVDPARRSVVIPAYRFTDRRSVQRRNCTQDWKIAPINQWLAAQHAGARVRVGMGISADEFYRVRDRHWHDMDGRRKLGFWRQRWYPLIELNLSRQDCIAIIEREGLPVPPKSSCYFCPFLRRAEWVTLRAEKPDLFEKAAELEVAMNNKGLAGIFRLHPTPTWQPLREWVSSNTTIPLFEDDKSDDKLCDAGVCFT